ncbi:MAG: NAD(P) transhydrogenase subunit alpha [candidate division WOR-3 bacterium]|nr:NAD(P) transhydrogenase subunit alpha [candidate division WOR-3 bacterium]MCX7947745.1 NAD(P) transhydrogenase subunit alpha [candidate division WOR-3 bacterium]MDW8150332.1 NAD(P) transhydrogenase subunit alpha [candidate division WOR-3 bacterium]
MEPIILSMVLFTLSLIIGFEVITKVPPILHTPLVVASHAMASIMVVSAIESAGSGSILGFIALLIGTINVVGGYFIADRMLSMFRKR